MDNQHKLISGYRDLSQEEVTLMNQIKEHGASLDVLIHKLNDVRGIDIRWLSIGKTNLQQGMMALVRSVAQPTGF